MVGGKMAQGEKWGESGKEGSRGRRGREGRGALLCSSRSPWSKMLIKQIHIVIIYMIYTYVYIISQVSGCFFLNAKSIT